MKDEPIKPESLPGTKKGNGGRYSDTEDKEEKEQKPTKVKSPRPRANRYATKKSIEEKGRAVCPMY